LHKSAPRASRNPNHRAQFRWLWIMSGMTEGSVADLCRLGCGTTQDTGCRVQNGTLTIPIIKFRTA